MSSIDDKIKQALSEEFNQAIKENDKIDANPFKQMSVGFKGKMGWMYIGVIIFGVISTFVSIYSIYSFYFETETKALIGWAVVIIISIFLTQISKMWYWSELGRNRIIRELKLLELQLAQAIDNKDKNN